MLEISLPDGTKRQYQSPVTAMQVAESIGAGLAAATLAAEVDGVLIDACDPIDRDASLRLITAKDKEGLEIIRHSCAHMLGHAMKQLHPEAQMVIGPVIEDGFYYDIHCQKHFTPDDMEVLEQRMAELIKTGYQVVKRMVARAEAVKIFRERGEDYKLRLLEQMPASVTEVGLYYHQEYIDMCRGPHVPNTRFLSAFRLTHLSGAYWQGDPANEMLQRIYGTAWASKSQLKDWLYRREEAERRDHRRLGSRLDLFSFREQAPGMVFWHSRGWTLYQLVENHIRRAIAADYLEVHTPQLLDKTLWQRSGHWEKFGDMIFTTESEKRDYAVKPMNCPAHVQIFNQRLRSYHELPWRVAEFGVVHRNEPSGTLHGLLRARRFTQDDAHIFCLPEQLADEIDKLFALIFRIYSDFGFDDIILALSTRPSQRVGSDAEWDAAERQLQQALERQNLEYTLQSGEGAFYGPKIEFSLRDTIGRIWQCGTIQLDFSMPGRLGAKYVGADSARHTPVMIHRAVLGSLERFIGILIEHYAGNLPLWLAPEQLGVMNITDAQASYVRDVTAKFAKSGLRVTADLRNEKIGFKIREMTLQKIPYMAIIGAREMQSQTVSVRTRSGQDIGSMSVAELTQLLHSEAAH